MPDRGPTSRQAPLRAAVVGLAGLVGLLAVACGPGSTAAAGLQEGDCFDLPAADVSVDSVQARTCSEPHTAEVFHVFDHAQAPGAPYPSDEGWKEAIWPVCDPAFLAWTGTPHETQQELDYLFFVPTREDWERRADRRIACFLHRIDRQPVSRSYLATAPPS